MESSCRELEALHGSLEQRLGGWIDLAELAHLSGSLVRVACDMRKGGKASCLSLPSGKHPGTYVSGAFTHAAVGKLLIFHTGHFDMDIDAVEKGTGETLLIAGDGGRRTCTLARGVTQKAAWTPVRVTIVNIRRRVCCRKRTPCENLPEKAYFQPSGETEGTAKGENYLE